VQPGEYCTFYFVKMSGLSIVSANCQGLGHYEKRRDVFQFLRTKKASVYFLQDIHLTKKR
jgi:hypothetical protein